MPAIVSRAGDSRRARCSRCFGSVDESWSMPMVSQPATTTDTAPRTTSCVVRDTPRATLSAPMPAPAKAPMLHHACMPFMSGRSQCFSTAIAWVFIEMSSEPWKAPQPNSASASWTGEPAMPTNGPAAQ